MAPWIGCVGFQVLILLSRGVAGGCIRRLGGPPLQISVQEVPGPLGGGVVGGKRAPADS